VRSQTAVEQIPARIERQHAHRLVAAAEAVGNLPHEGLAAAGANGRAILSRQALREHLQASETCQLEAFEAALALAAEQASAAFQAQDGWVDRVRAGLLALLEFFDEEPALARYLVVHSAQAGEAILTRRCEVIDQIALLLDDERAPARAYPPPLSAQAVASGVLGVVHARLCQPQAGALVELAGPLMSFTVLPFLGFRAARRELAHPLASGRVPLELLHDRGGQLNSRAAAVVGVVGAEPGLNNRQVAERASIKDGGQSSRLLARLERLGLIENTGDAHRRAAAKAWRLTVSGERLEARIRRELAEPEPTSAFDLPQEFAGRLADGAVLLLRAIGDQPWLRSAEVAQRAGVADQTLAASLLESLVDLGLAVSERDALQKGAPKVWRLTPSGEQLDAAVERDAPAPPRSVALDLMWESGGRLSDNAISALRAIGAEPGLSNNHIALQVGIADENVMSQLLARLAKRGLVENMRNGGRYNVWQLTPAGEKTERVIWHETPPAAQRKLAHDLLRERGGRLNHRVASVLRIIGAEPGHSNQQISERVGIDGKGHASTLLARLARFGLIENLVVDPAPFEANAWQLTATGTELEAAIRDDGDSTPARRSRSAHHTVTAKECR
jgi:DNA-binding MarR family transcriptional regulator